jgi:hypothetical protein
MVAKMSRLWLIVVAGAVVSGFVFARGEPERAAPPPSPPSAYEVYFRGLTPEEQAAEFVKQSAELYLQIGPEEPEIAGEILSTETGLDAMPYLRLEFARLEFEFSPTTDGGLRSQSPMNLLALISGMVWDTGFPQNEGLFLRPADEDIRWFCDEASAKIQRYIETYKRIDGNILTVEWLILSMTDREAAQAYWDNEPGRLVYDRYVRGNPELESEVAITETYVFPGYRGPIIETFPGGAGP